MINTISELHIHKGTTANESKISVLVSISKIDDDYAQDRLQKL